MTTEYVWRAVFSDEGANKRAHLVRASNGMDHGLTERQCRRGVIVNFNLTTETTLPECQHCRDGEKRNKGAGAKTANWPKL